MKRLILLLPVVGLIWYLWPGSVSIWNTGNYLGIGPYVSPLLWDGFTPLLKRRAGAAGHLKTYRTGTQILSGLLSTGFLWVGVLTVQMILAANHALPRSTPTVVLSSQVRGDEPSLDLWARIGATERYLKENPEVMYVMSGGQGEGENRSEAEVIREKPVERDISSDRVLLEDRPESTKENVRYSKELLDKHSLDFDAATVTGEYRQLRASWLAKQQGLIPYAVNAESPHNILSAMYTREPLALTATLLQS